MLTAEDRKQLSQKGISEQQIETQLQQFREGFPYLRLRGACGGCPHAQMTLKQGIEAYLRNEVDPEIVVERA